MLRARSFNAIFLTLALSALTAPAGAVEPLVEPLSDGAVLDLPELRGGVPSPAEFLGYPLGDRFTHHARIVEYMEALAESSERVVLSRYGETYEGRPLLLAAISSPANIARLDEIRARHARLADPRGAAAGEIADVVANDPVIAWLGYGVHGNESSSAEAALLTAYVLAAADDGWAARLDDVVVLIDPLVNPDGRERYVHFFETQRGRRPNPSPISSEHWEPWPGGRQNHYLVDLNRDWAWASQIETESRLAAYRRWEPQVHVDFHEMWSDSTYFFPPAAEPISPLIPRTTIGWLDVFGRANAGAFDRQGWTYYVGQRFDLFYPGYGDSYPGLRGAIGMTYEMAGHGRAGSVIERPNGELLTLADRLARHYTTSIATVQAAIDNREGLLRDFAASRRAAIDAAPRAFLWKAGDAEARAAAELLRGHGIAVETLPEPRRLSARPHSGGGAARQHDFPAGTYVVNTRQPLGALARALMEPDVPMDKAFIDAQRARIELNQRPQFYDITAWSLPLAYNLEAWSHDGAVSGRPLEELPAGSIGGAGELGYLIPPQGLAGYRAAARLHERDVRFRLAIESLRLDGVDYPAGTLFVPRRGNRDDLDAIVGELAASVRVDRTGTSLSETRVSLGSDEVVPIRRASIGVVSGEGVSVTSFGYLWHLLDRQIGAQHHRLDVSTLSHLDLGRLDVIVLPDGSYSDAIGDQTAERIGAWVDGGGILVAVGDAVEWVAGRELVEVERWQAPEDDGEDNEVVEVTPANRPLYTPGAALATRLRQVHPLASGLATPPAVIFQGRTILLPSGDPRNDLLVAADENPVVAGFAWPEAAERLAGSLLVGTHVRGAGGVILFAQEPAYRLFWRSTAPIFLNAVMYGPSLAERRSLVE